MNATVDTTGEFRFIAARIRFTSMRLWGLDQLVSRGNRNRACPSLGILDGSTGNIMR